VRRANLYFSFDFVPRFELLLFGAEDISIFPAARRLPLFIRFRPFSVDFLRSGTTIDNWIFAVSNPIYFVLNTKT